MKRVLILSVLFMILGTNICMADNTDMLSVGIDAYKNGNYIDCITTMKSIVKNDPTSAIGYYYLALAYTKTGKKFLAIRNYDKVIALNSDTTLTELAKQGKLKVAGEGVTAIEAQIKDIEEDAKDSQNIEQQEKLTPAELRQKYEEKITNNDKKQEPKTTQVIKASDYAKSNAQPTNDEIVNAIRILQKAGLLNSMGGMNYNGYNPQMDAKTQQMNAMMMMMNNGNNNGMMNMMPYMNNNGKPDPQMIQMMMMNQMMPNFSSGNNNNGY